MSQLAAKPGLFQSRLLRTWIWVSVVIAGCLLAYGLGRERSEPVQTIHGLFVDPSYLDFGEVWEQHNIIWTLPIHNRSDADVAISSFAPSPLIMDVSPSNMVIPAGATSEARVTLDLTGRPTRATDGPRIGEGSGRRRDSYTFEPLVTFEVPVGPQVMGCSSNEVGWRLKGRVRRILSLTPSFVEFDITATPGRPFQSKLVTVTQHLPLATLTCRCDSALALAQFDARGRVLHIRPARTLPGGSFAFDVKLQATTTGGEKLPIMRLPVSGRLLRDVHPSPEALNFGAAFIGESLTETIVLRARSGKPFVVEKAHSPNPDLTIEGLTMTPAALARVQITQRIARVGAQKGRINFVVRTIGEDEETVSVELSYYGRSATNGA
jgi:hypothetical protein